MRIRSPRIAPPENGDDGSMASTATRSLPSIPRVRACSMSRSVRVDLPAPGAPVIPIVYACPDDAVGQGGHRP